MQKPAIPFGKPLLTVKLFQERGSFGAYDSDGNLIVLCSAHSPDDFFKILPQHLSNHLRRLKDAPDGSSSD